MINLPSVGMSNMYLNPVRPECLPKANVSRDKDHRKNNFDLPFDTPLYERYSGRTGREFFFLLLLLALLLRLSPALSFQRPMVVVIPSRNNAPWCKKNLTSVFKQRYDNYRVVYIDDCSTDETYQLAHDSVADYTMQSRVTIIKNKRRRGA